jgi:hypothetical protein
LVLVLKGVRAWLYEGRQNNSLNKHKEVISISLCGPAEGAEVSREKVLEGPSMEGKVAVVKVDHQF